MTIIAIQEYELQCVNCGVLRKNVGFDLHMTYLWANQYGTKIRLFCHRCGSVNDVKLMVKGDIEITPHSMRCAVYK